LEFLSRSAVCDEAIPWADGEIASRRALAMTRRSEMADKAGYVYIITNQRNTVLYTGVTSDLKKRVWQHKEKLVGGFTKRYNVDKLVYYEALADMTGAIAREKQIKGGSRQRKLDLINGMNPEWRDLYEGI
jgi:putative endonuclease